MDRSRTPVRPPARASTSAFTALAAMTLSACGGAAPFDDVSFQEVGHESAALLSACFDAGGFCDASNTCTRYEATTEGLRAIVLDASCAPTGYSGGGGGGGGGPTIPAPALALSLTFSAYIPKALPSPARRIKGDPCRGSPMWNELRNHPVKPSLANDEALFETFPILPDPLGIAFPPFGGFFFSLERRFRDPLAERPARMKIEIPIALPALARGAGPPETYPSNWVARCSPTRYYEDALYYSDPFARGVSACVVAIDKATPTVADIRNDLVNKSDIYGTQIRVVSASVSASNPLQPAGPAIDIRPEAEVYVHPITGNTHVQLQYAHDQFPNYDVSVSVTPSTGGAPRSYGLLSYGAVVGTACQTGPTPSNLTTAANTQKVKFALTPSGDLYSSDGSQLIGGRIPDGGWLRPLDLCEIKQMDATSTPFETPPPR